MLSLSVNLIEFDPDIIDTVVTFFGVAGKYAFLFAICSLLMRMVVRAATGKERFI